MTSVCHPMAPMVRWLLLLLTLGLSGCGELAHRVNELHGYNCRPETITQYGSCTLTRGAQR